MLIVLEKDVIKNISKLDSFQYSVSIPLIHRKRNGKIFYVFSHS